MFTGIIQSVGKIRKKIEISSKEGGGLSFEIGSRFKSLKKGESISVQGVCLTAVKKKESRTGKSFWVEVGEETLRKTTLGDLQNGSAVNLERALKAGESLSGHFVLGHVDGTGKILEIRPEGNSKLFLFSYPETLGAYLLPKGSIAVDGISLTLVEVKKEFFSVSILPFTERETTLKNKKVNDAVNLETDLLARMIAKQIKTMGSAGPAAFELYQKKAVSWDEILHEENAL